MAANLIQFATRRAAPPPPPPPQLEPPVAEWQPAPLHPERAGRGRMVGYAVALSPLVLIALLAWVAPRYLAPLGDDRVSLIGLPGGEIFLAFVLVFIGMGVAAVRYVRNPAAAGAVVFLMTTMSLAVISLGPAVILIMINLKT
jgi:hypothetical protein